MALVDGYREAPYQGVSQAPPQVRLPAQAELIENALVAIPDGLTPRPPFVYRGVLLAEDARTDGVFEYLSGQSVILSINTEGGSPTVRLFNYADLSEASLTIEPEAQAYLDAGVAVPVRDFGKLSVADYTFLWNRQLDVALSSDTVTARPEEALIFVKQGAYGKTYSVTVHVVGVADFTTSYTTPDGDTQEESPWIDTDEIARILLTVDMSIDGVTPGDSDTDGMGLEELIDEGFTVTRHNGVIYLSHPTASFTVSVTDGQAGEALVAVKGKARRLSDLPASGAPDGFVARIGQDSGNEDDDYFVRFTETAGPGTGVWQETLKPGVNVGVDPETLPIALSFDGTDWTLDVQPWTQRLVGDDVLSPDPGFIGEPIADMTFWRGRIVMLYKESCLLGSSEDPFQIYPQTLSAVLDSDPIELTSPFPDVSLLRYATPFDNRLVLSGDKAHLYVESEGAVTPQTTRIDTLFASELLGGLRPSFVKSRLYFAAPKGEGARAYASINEVYTDRTINTTEPEDLTVVLPRYLPASVDRVATCDVQFLNVYGESGGTKLYPHLFRYDKTTAERLQNALVTWTLPSGYTLGGMFFKNTALVLLLVDEDEVGHVVECDTASGALDPHADSTMLTLWDMRVDEEQVTLSYDEETDTTIALLPYTPSDDIRASVRAPDGLGGPALTDDLLPAVEGQLIEVVAVDAGAKEVTLSGDWTECPLFIGEPYAMRMRPSRIFAFDDNNKPLRSGRLTIQRILFDLADAGYLRVEVRAGGRPVRTYEYSGYRWDDPLSAPDTAPSSDVTFTVPIHCSTDDLTIDVINDSHLSCKVLGFNWFGKYNPKARRIG